MGSKKDKASKLDDHLGKQRYHELLEPLQVELNNLARWVQHNQKRVLILFEGRDTAGKGGVINAISETLNPRLCQVVALSKPTEVEQSEWYFQRYVSHLPAGGHIVLMDRSWYNRAGVEKVMGYSNAEQVNAFLNQVPLFENMLINDGVVLFKYWLTVDQTEQERRLAERLNDPLKRWKLSPIDLEARQKYQAYGEARDTMLAATHTPQAPWTLVDFNDQRLGRLTLIRHLLDHLPDCSVPEAPLEFPPLKGELGKEVFNGPVKPIPAVDTGQASA